MLAPGLVCLRRAIDLETQAWLAERAFEVGEGKDGRQGFYDTVPGDAPGDAPVLRLNQGTRGRVILPVSDFPETRAHRSRLRPVRADGGLVHERPRHEPDDRAGQLLQRGRQVQVAQGQRGSRARQTRHRATHRELHRRTRRGFFVQEPVRRLDAPHRSFKQRRRLALRWTVADDRALGHRRRAEDDAADAEGKDVTRSVERHDSRHSAEASSIPRCSPRTGSATAACRAKTRTEN